MDDSQPPQNKGGWTPAQPGQPGQPNQQGQPVQQGQPAPQGQQAQNDWGQAPPTQAPMQATPGFQTPKSGIADGIGTLDDSTALFPEIKESIKTFFGLVKGPIMYAILAFVGVQLLINILATVTAMGFGLAGLGGLLSSIVLGLGGLVTTILSIIAAVYTVALFRPANDQLTGFTQGPPESFMAAIKSSSPAFIPVLLACLMCGGMVAVGSMFCLVPGLIALVVLLPMRYLSATRPDFTEYKFTKVLERSITLGKKYWVAVLALGLAIGMVAGIGAAISAVVNTITLVIQAAVLSGMDGSAGGTVLSTVIGLGAQTISALIAAAVVLVNWVFEGGVMNVISRHDTQPNQ